MKSDLRLRTVKIHSLQNLCFLLLLAIASLATIRSPLIIAGDGLEYLVQTQALVFDQQFKIDTEARRAYWNNANPFGKTLDTTRPPTPPASEATQAGGGFGGLYPDRYGNYRYIHTPTYSLLVAPFYAITHLLDSSKTLEYLSFRIFNLICLFAPLVYAWQRRRSWWLLLPILSLLAAPVRAYAEWFHPEVFQFAFISLAFMIVRSKRSAWIAPILLGIAASQNFPILVMFAALFAYAYANQEISRMRSGKILAAWIAGIVLGCSSFIVNYYYFGVPSLFASIGFVHAEYASIWRMSHHFLSPIIGVLWFYPLLILGLPIFLFSAGSAELAANFRVNIIAGIITLVAIGIASYLTTTIDNLTSSLIGTVRYATWFIAPLVGQMLMYNWGAVTFSRKKLVYALCVGAAWCAIVANYRTYELLFRSPVRFQQGVRAQPEAARIYKLLHYHDDIEILVENIKGEELRQPWDFNGIYIWNLGGPHSMWIISKRALESSHSFTWHTDTLPKITSSPLNALFIAKDAAVKLQRADALHFHKHPVWGSYILAWVEARISREQIASDASVVVTSSD